MILAIKIWQTKRIEPTNTEMPMFTRDKGTSPMMIRQTEHVNLKAYTIREATAAVWSLPWAAVCSISFHLSIYEQDAGSNERDGKKKVSLLALVQFILPPFRSVRSFIRRVQRMSECVIQIPDRYGPREMLHNTHACIEDGQKFKWQMLQKMSRGSLFG